MRSGSDDDDDEEEEEEDEDDEEKETDEDDTDESEDDSEDGEMEETGSVSDETTKKPEGCIVKQGGTLHGGRTVLMTKVDVSMGAFGMYNFYRMQIWKEKHKDIWEVSNSPVSHLNSCFSVAICRNC